ncbi:MAG TPA: hypothetical protein VMB71_13710 [Acetobacteraceae bacterium]|nr:hypothetical protein [Acetobacteraceae bacterium]
MTLFFRWSKTDEESMADYKAGKLSYSYSGKPSRKAFWVFELSSTYRPGRRIARDRILLAFDFGPRGDAVVKNPDNWVHFPSAEFVGETKHPTKIIVKDNEPGAYGIGQVIFEMLPAVSIRLATKQEIASSLDLRMIEIDWTQRWP